MKKRCAESVSGKEGGYYRSLFRSFLKNDSGLFRGLSLSGLSIRENTSFRALLMLPSYPQVSRLKSNIPPHTSNTPSSPGSIMPKMM